MRDTIPEESVLDLLAVWENAEREGRPIPLEGLAPDDPELLAELKRRVALLRGIRDLDPGPTAASVGAPAAEPGPIADHERYDVRGEINRGGMGVVLRAYDRQLHREIALKIMHREREVDPAMRLRFVEEAQLTGQLQHPGIPPIFERGAFPDGRPFYTMKLVKGETLAALLGPDEERATTAPRRDLPRWLSVFEAICQAVAYAHSKNVIHRDLKPANVMVGAFGEVQVMDWGLAKVLGAAPAVERAGSVVRTVRTEGPDSALRTGTVGTPAHMPPEQAQGLTDQVDARADVFALGSILCDVLTGQPAYVGRSRDEVLRKALRGDLADAHARLEACGADADLIALARRCLAAEPLDRPANAGEVAQGIAAYQAAVSERLKAEELGRVAAETRAEEATKRAVVERSRRRRTLALAVATLCLVGVVAGGGLYLTRQRETRQRETARAVDDALAQADLAQGRAEGLTDPAAQVAAWNEALAHVKRADDALRGGEAPKAARSRVDARWTQIDARLAAVRERERDARIEARLVKRLEAVRGSRAEHFDTSQTDRDYADAFREAGLDLEAMDPAEATSRLARSQAIDEIVAGIDDWCAIRRWNEGQGQAAPTWVRLNRVATLVDKDPWRNEVRATFGRPLNEVMEALKAKAEDVASLGRQPVTSLVLLARLFQRGGVPDHAARVLREAWRRHPGDFWANYELGGTSWDWTLGKYAHPEEAVRFLTVAAALRPNSAVARGDLGTALRDQGRYDEARAEIQEALRWSPDSPYLLNSLGHVLRSQGRFDEANAAYRATLRLKPDDSVAHRGLGTTFSWRGEHAEAIAAFKEAIRIQPDDHMAHGELGTALAEVGQLDQAIAALRESIRLRPDYSPGHLGLVMALFKTRRLEEAIRSHAESIQLRPDDHLARAFLGLALSLQGQFDKSHAQFRESIRLRPDFEISHLLFGSILRITGDLTQATTELQEAIRLNPYNYFTYHELGQALQAGGDNERAIAAFQAAIRLNPALASAFHHMGDALRALNRLPEAIAACAEAVRLAPKDAEAHVSLASAFQGNNEYDRAIVACRRAIELDASNQLAHFGMGNALNALGRFDEAAASFQEALRIQPDHAEAHCRLGLTFQSLGRHEEAIVELKRGHELGAKAADWSLPSQEWLKRAEVLGGLAGRLPRLLRGEDQPGDNTERLDFAQVCYDTKHHAAAARLWAEALEHDPQLAEDRQEYHRYNAACAAALAGCGQGIDDPSPDAPARARLREQALQWLHAELDAWETRTDGPTKPLIIGTLDHWRRDRDLAGVRDVDALAQLAGPERDAWKALWDRVAALRARLGKSGQDQ